MIRKSILKDAQHFVEVKNQLVLSLNDKNSGGFLLGTDVDTYTFYIKNGKCLTAVANDNVVGFGIVLPDSIVRNSMLWEKRRTASWTINLKDLEESNIAYFEQLAFLKSYKRLSISLAYQLASTAFGEGADFILTTTVVKPVQNLAAIPYIEAVGGLKIGNIDEVYPAAGKINSNIYLISRESFYERIKQVPFYKDLRLSD